MYLVPVHSVWIFLVLVSKQEINYRSRLYYHRSWSVWRNAKAKKSKFSSRMSRKNLIHIRSGKELPIFRDKPPWVVLKLEWNPLQPLTPPPIGTKFFTSLWKRTGEQGGNLCEQIWEHDIKDQAENLFEIQIPRIFNLLPSCTLAQNNIQHSQSVLKILCLLPLKSACNSLHGDLCSITYLNHEFLSLVGTPWSFSISIICIISSVISADKEDIKAY